MSHYPPCPTRSGDHCSYLLEQTGDGYITPEICRHCRYSGGPFMGAPAHSPERFLSAIGRTGGISFKKSELISIPSKPPLPAIMMEAKMEWQRSSKSTWEQASSFYNAVASRGFAATVMDLFGLNNKSGARVSDKVYDARKVSCFGDKLRPKCDMLFTNQNGSFCSACGCRDKGIARLDSMADGNYTKLHYPKLECPLKRNGFSNHDASDTIFIMIIAYRDPELLPTLMDMVKNASHPENLRIGILRDYGPEENLHDLDELKSAGIVIRTLERPYTEGRGICDARARAQALYGGEKWVLNIDSHHRFIKNWDAELIESAQKLIADGYSKPLLSTVLPAYDPGDDSYFNNQGLFEQSFEKFGETGNVCHVCEWLSTSSDRPVPGRMISGHFIFTLGKWIEEVKLDPNFYMKGEEIMMAVKSYTWGYDIFTPHKVFCWHQYGRNSCIKQWSDDKEWWKKEQVGEKRQRVLFEMEDIGSIDFGVYGLGKVRTLAQYEEWSGINFKQRTGIRKWHPPNNTTK